MWPTLWIQRVGHTNEATTEYNPGQNAWATHSKHYNNSQFYVNFPRLGPSDRKHFLHPCPPSSVLMELRVSMLVLQSECKVCKVPGILLLIIWGGTKYQKTPENNQKMSGIFWYLVPPTICTRVSFLENTGWYLLINIKFDLSHSIFLWRSDHLWTSSHLYLRLHETSPSSQTVFPLREKGFPRSVLQR